MEVITIESAVWQQLQDRIEIIEKYVKDANETVSIARLQDERAVHGVVFERGSFCGSNVSVLRETCLFVVRRKTDDAVLPFRGQDCIQPSREAFALPPVGHRGVCPRHHATAEQETTCRHSQGMY